jgi:hypothetical protein
MHVFCTQGYVKVDHWWYVPSRQNKCSPLSKALDKSPGVHPMGIGEVWMRYYSQNVFFSLPEANLEMSVEWTNFAQAWRPALEAGSMLSDLSGIYKLKKRNRVSLWLMQEMHSTKGTGQKCVGPSNAWPSGTRYVFNCYRQPLVSPCGPSQQWQCYFPFQ